jgi:hypothetical protein
VRANGARPICSDVSTLETRRVAFLLNPNTALGNGAQTARLLGLSIDRPGANESLGAELSRRRFWACYLMEAHSSDTVFTTRTPPESVANLTLPCRDEDFNAGCPRDPTCLGAFRSNGSVYGELTNAMTLW